MWTCGLLEAVRKVVTLCSLCALLSVSDQYRDVVTRGDFPFHVLRCHILVSLGVTVSGARFLRRRGR